MIRWGIAGFGRHAVKRLMPGFALARNSVVAALSRRDLQRARQSAGAYNMEHAFASTEELCRCSQVDAVFVASPDAVHLPDALIAIRAKKPVLVEKPMAMNAGEAAQMVEAAKAAGVKLGVAHVFRFNRTAERARQIIAEGKLGALTHVHSEFHYPVVGHGRLWLTDPTLACGGPIADVGVHCLDTLRFVLNDEIEELGAMARQDADSGPVEAAGVLSICFRSGTLGTVVVSTRSQYRTPFEAVGQFGSLRADNFLSVDQDVTLERLHDGEVVEAETLSNADAYARQVDSFSGWLEGKADFPCPGEQGLRNQLLLDAAYRSWRSAKTERIS